MNRTPLLASLLLPLALAGCASAPPYLAKVNGEPITADELKEQFVKRHGGHEKFLAGMVEVNEFVDIVVDWKLLIQEAYRLEIEETPAIKAEVDSFRERRSLEYLLKTEIEDKSVPSWDEIRDAWEKHTSEVVTARQIVVASRREAEEIRRGLEGGAEFEALARSCSIAPSNVHDGLLPEIAWGTMEPSWDAAVLPLAPGELSPVFEVKDGWEVDRLEERFPVDRPTLAQARMTIEGILKRRKLEERRRALSEYLDAKYHVSYPVSDRSPETLGRLLAASPAAPVATWDGGALAMKDFLSAKEIEMLRSFPPPRARAHVEDLLRRSLNEELARREAKERRLAEVPEVADEVREHQEDLMERALYADHILKDVTVTDDDVKAWFEKHKEELVTPERRRVAHIVVATEEEAKEIRKRLDAGESFTELVKTRSKDTATVKQGGDLGFISKKDVPAEFASVLALKVDEVSQPIRSKYGWHLIRVNAIEPPRPIPFEEAKADIEKRVREEKYRERRAYWVGKLRAAATIKVSRSGVKRFIAENSH